jgi:two-component system OmpR family sensor kinase
MGRIAPDAVWHRITAESARMTGLVEDLLLLARLDAGRPLHAAEADLAAVVAEAVADTRTLGADHVWRLRLPVGSPALTVGDHPHLKQAVTALLVNACVHTPPGTTVTVALETTAGRHTVRVRDDGPGIPHHLLPAVFDPFTRADPSRTRTGLGEGGSRLGLAVAAAITGAHRGRIDVHSAPGRTEFRIELPVAGPSPGTPAAPYGSACSAQITLP